MSFNASEAGRSVFLRSFSTPGARGHLGPIEFSLPDGEHRAGGRSLSVWKTCRRWASLKVAKKAVWRMAQSGAQAFASRRAGSSCSTSPGPLLACTKARCWSVALWVCSIFSIPAFFQCRSFVQELLPIRMAGWAIDSARRRIRWREVLPERSLASLHLIDVMA